MSEKRGMSETTELVAAQDPDGMVKPALVEPQFPGVSSAPVGTSLRQHRTRHDGLLRAERSLR